MTPALLEALELCEEITARAHAQGSSLVAYQVGDIERLCGAVRLLTTERVGVEKRSPAQIEQAERVAKAQREAAKRADPEGYKPDATPGGLRRMAATLEHWVPEAMPANDVGQVHFVRCLTESAAEALRAAADKIMVRGRGAMRRRHRQLVDLVWNHVTQSETVPSTKVADQLIDQAFPAGYGDPMADALTALVAVRPSNWDDDDDPEQVAAWRAAEKALADG